MPSVIEWTLVIILDVVHSGFIIAILYTLVRFYKHRYSQALQKRSPLLVYLMNICFIIYLLYNITYKIAYILGQRDWNIDPILNDEEIRYPHFIKLISVICYIFSLHGMVIAWIARLWKVYFNCQYRLEVQKIKWGVHLNDHYSETLWFVKHRKDYGSNRLIYPIAITWHIIQALLQTFLLFKYQKIWFFCDSASLLYKLIILLIIWHKIPSFNDIFGIKKEMQWMFRISGITLLLYIGYIVSLMILGHDLHIFMAAQFIFGVMVGVLALILNGFIFHNPKYNHLISIYLIADRLRAISTRSACDNPTGDRLSLSQVLGNEPLIQCLFAHLADEFSVELLLALIEFKQFHDLMTNDEQFMDGIQNIIYAKDTGISDNILSRISLADELPKSSIVHCADENKDHIKMYLKIARNLFNKYVSNKAVLVADKK